MQSIKTALETVTLVQCVLVCCVKLALNPASVVVIQACASSSCNVVSSSEVYRAKLKLLKLNSQVCSSVGSLTASGHPPTRVWLLIYADVGLASCLFSGLSIPVAGFVF